MTEKSDYIWYASYGSNLLKERFLFYIKGGKPLGAKNSYDGCRDKTLPKDNQNILINGELYFAKKSENWGGGVGFIKVDFHPQIQTLGRMYLITKDQFIDVVKQETNKDVNESLTIDFGRAISEGSLIFKEGSWYGNLIYLGTQDKYPIFTFTNQNNISETTKPSEKYIKTIIMGIQEVYDLSEQEIVDYFITKLGVVGNYSREEIANLVKN